MPVVCNVTNERIRDNETGEVFACGKASEDKLLPRSILFRELLARCMFMRYSMGLSVHRILKELEANRLNITSQSIYRWSIQYALALARPMCTRLLQKILESGKVQTDETWTKIREDLKKENRRNSILWLIRTSEKLNIPPMVVLSYTGSRASASFAGIIKGFARKIMSDGYSGYSALLNEFADSIVLVGCLQHARAKFMDVIQSLKGKKEYQSLAAEVKAGLPVNQILDLFAEVFKAEKEMSAEWSLTKKKAYRKNVMRPKLDALFAKIAEELPRQAKNSKSYLLDALEYTMKFKDRFYEAVDGPEMPLSNNACERAFAAYGVLRSNYKQEDTILGTQACCDWFSLIQTAWENDVNEQNYLEFIIEKLPDVLREHGHYHWMSMKDIKQLKTLPEYADLSYLDTYMPWSQEYKEFEQKYQKRQKDLLTRIGTIIQQNQGVFQNQKSA